jgi:hypothetical protein
MSSTLDPSLILYVLILLLKFVATVRTDIVFGVKILAALGAGEGELCTAGGTDLIIGIQGIAAVRAEVHATGRTFLIVLVDRLAAIATKGGALEAGAGLTLLCGRLGTFVFETLLEFSATMGTDCRLGRDLFITCGTIEAELSPALGTDSIVGIHLSPAFGTVGILIVRIVDFLTVNQICYHDAPRF